MTLIKKVVICTIVLFGSLSQANAANYQTLDFRFGGNGNEAKILKCFITSAAVGEDPKYYSMTIKKWIKENIKPGKYKKYENDSIMWFKETYAINGIDYFRGFWFAECAQIMSRLKGLYSEN